MQNKRSILWFVFAFSLIMLYDGWQKQLGHPTLFGMPIQSQPASDKAGAANAKTEGGVPTDSKRLAVEEKTGVAETTGMDNKQNGEVVEVKTDVLALQFNTQGAVLQRAELLQQRDLQDKTKNMVLLDKSSDRVYLAQSGLTGGTLPNHKTPYKLISQERQLAEGKDTLELVFVAQTEGITLKQTYTLKRASYAIAVKHEIINQGGQAITPSLYLQLTRDSSKPEVHSEVLSAFTPTTFTGPAVYSEEKKFQKVEFKAIAEDKKDRHLEKGSQTWIAMVQHYYVSAWIPENKNQHELRTNKISNDLYSVAQIQPLEAIATGASRTVNNVLYVGPQDQKALEALAPGLELVADYGWLAIIAKPIFALLQLLHDLTGNWGWAIILLTILLKLVFYPLSAAGYKSMARMKNVTPRMQALKEKYGDDRAKLNQAMMDLYRTEKINPLGGCFPMLIQIPVFIALYWVLLASVEMRGAPWLGWIQDLATPDPWYILPAIMMVSMFVQFKLNPTPVDPVQQKVMMIMPLVFGVMFFFFPAGLVLYWVVNNILSIAQQWAINKQLEKAGLK
ncbi:membrane protein insertase YidC [Parvibium lacunae]|uniref:Membrane protein insertase YidC n=1 Tax=Parvibium lacunae TaxID=1888893 RepID=A0A368L1P9_9BURK|nr:membrane protein insertase YidC [Parvibium lacunae]RCS57022.1 membrane protein insertase YidC [Parvibium lacunae]